MSEAIESKASEGQVTPFKYICYYVNFGSKIFMLLVTMIVTSAYLAKSSSMLWNIFVGACAFAYALRIIPWERMDQMSAGKG